VEEEEEEEEEEAQTSSVYARCVHQCACVRLLVTGRVDTGIWPVCQCERRQLTRSHRSTVLSSAGAF